MPERILICGDRNWSDYEMIDKFISSLPKDSIVINGVAKGADLAGDKAAKQYGFEVLEFPADWAQFSRSAGPIRNSQILREGKPTRVVAYHNDLQNSRGTKHMVSISLKKGVPVYLNVKLWVDIELGLAEKITNDFFSKTKDVEAKLFT